MYISLPGHEGNRCAGSCSDGSSNQRALTASGESANQGAATATPGDPSPVALPVIAADSLRGGRAELIRLAVNFEGFKSELQTRSPHQPTGWTRLQHQSFGVSTPRNDGVFIDDYGLCNCTLEVITRAALVACQSLIRSDMKRGFFGNRDWIRPTRDRSFGRDDSRQQEQGSNKDEVTILLEKHDTSNLEQGRMTPKSRFMPCSHG
jgi:hypothetical protein